MKKSRRITPMQGAEVISIDGIDLDTTCSVCFAEFLDPEDLEVHVQQVHPPSNFIKCQVCDITFSDAEVYVLHLRDVHLCDLRTCEQCSRVFADSTLLKKHYAKHDTSVKDRFVCSQCKEPFKNTSELEYHEVNNHSNAKDGFFLHQFYSLLSSVLNMKADGFLKSVGTEVYLCSVCKYTTEVIEDYINHLKEKGCRSIACDKCFKVFAKKHRLRDHVHAHTECHNYVKEDLVNTCKECNRTFEYLVYREHVKKCKVIKCNTCNIVFDSIDELSDHQNKEHPLAIALTMCQFCRRECVGKLALEKHIDRAHSHELHLYKYTCSYCDIVFKHPQRLFGHYFTNHKELEPYWCKICDKKFRIRKQLTLHIKLVHNSVGFVEFDEKLHVFFSDKKSEKPFQPVSKFQTESKKNGAESDKSDVEAGNKTKKASVKSAQLNVENVNSDFMNPTETEGNQTEIDSSKTTTRRKTMIKRKRKIKSNKNDFSDIRFSDDVDSEDESLLVMKKKAKIKNQLQKRINQWNNTTRSKKTRKGHKQSLTCNICKKYCYTFQNYRNHVSMHFKNEEKKCVKCSQSFKSKVELQKHLNEEHGSSQLTETLKNLLARRKRGIVTVEPTMSRKFLNTIRRVKMDEVNFTATITPVGKELSVQKFIENFTPEGTEVKNLQIMSNNVSVTKVDGKINKEPLIKMTKFKPDNKEFTNRLAMPVKFKKVPEKHHVTIKRVEAVVSEDNQLYDDDYTMEDHIQDDEHRYHEELKEPTIPEVEQEVTLEGSEEAPKRNPATHKIVIPKLPKELKSIRIAHLLPEAPFYKIVKMDDIIKGHQKQKEKEVDVPAPRENGPVKLPDGTKLVHVNPLAHLLGDTPVKHILQSNKYYKPKPKNFETVLAKALLKLERPAKKIKKTAPKKEKVAKKKSNAKTDLQVLEDDEGEAKSLDDSEKNDNAGTEDRGVTEGDNVTNPVLDTETTAHEDIETQDANVAERIAGPSLPNIEDI